MVAGHEPLAHGWRWLPHSRYTDREEEQRDIMRTRDAIESATGVAPTGFFTRGGQSPWTRDLLAEFGFAHDFNALDDELPYWADARRAGGSWCFRTVSTRTTCAIGTRTASSDRTTSRSTRSPHSNVLLKEAEEGKSSMLTIGFHLRISGRPARFPQSRKSWINWSGLSKGVGGDPRRHRASFCGADLIRLNHHGDVILRCRCSEKMRAFCV